MSARTFYVAASSSPEGVKAARALAARLEGAGLTNTMAWWEYLGAPEEQWRDLAALDAEAAAFCDVFVLLPEPKSYGACVELGVRIASGSWAYGLTAYVVGPGGHELFCRHPLVERVESVDVLLAVLAGEAQA